MMQLSNGVPILSYLQGREDDQLVKLEDYLMSLRGVEDVRAVNREWFRLGEYVGCGSWEQVVRELYGKGGWM
jgi:hypothetical protein